MFTFAVNFKPFDIFIKSECFVIETEEYQMFAQSQRIFDENSLITINEANFISII